ncbi:MAG: hypothetical protein WC052_03035 [Patescibacteria group bacterium]
MPIAIGIVFHGFVTAVIAAVAFVLVYELLKRENDRYRSYSFFWLATGFLWLQNAIRNFGFGIFAEDFPRYESSVLSQATVFLSGVPLFYYVGIKVFRSKVVARLLAGQAAIAGIIGTYFLFQPSGIFFAPISFFTAEAVANVVSSMIFRVEIAVVALLLLTNIIRHRHDKQADGHNHEIWYDLAILLYVALGGIDLAKIVDDWALVIFRLLYCAAFLLVFILVRHDQENDDTYMVRTPTAT